MKASRYNVWVDGDDGDYLYNGMTGALLRVAPGDRVAADRFLAGDDAAGCSAALLADMAKGRMIVSDNFDELNALATRYELSRNSKDRFALTIVTSLGCNFDCPYCFEDKHPSILGEEVETACIAVLDDQLPTISSFSVNWYGGEPLVGKRPLIHLSRAFIERCDAAGVDYRAGIVTNGYLLDEQTCQELQACRVETAQVTLDGPPDTHDRMRPLVGGGPSFERIVDNLRTAVSYMGIAVRMNVDTANYGRAEELLQILAVHGLSGQVQVYLGQLVAVDDGTAAPSASYESRCFTGPEFAQAEIAFTELATRYGFSAPSVPGPIGAPCTAVRANELILGSDGELYKCWESVGNPQHVIGNIRDYRNLNGRLRRWLQYDPFADDECRGCPALPVCMGGCAHHSMDVLQHENRCDTFRYNYAERIKLLARAKQSGLQLTAVSAEPRFDTR